MDKDWIVVGRFGRPHGIKGLVSVISFTEPRENILRYLPWHVRKANQWLAINVQHVEAGSKTILARVEGYSEREEVAALTNLEIGIQAERLPPLKAGEYYWHQLIDMQVVNKEGISLGKIVEIMPTGANDVLVVVGEKRYLIPFLQDMYVLGVNETTRIITVDWDADFA
ncbi:16S rRNA processing protein RimM (plasmid) [Legionella adelaidensis]|uniref:Ribosome maturation factor RimM n=1 Tax=Legionella adelaidensis TaxID=45056 RepID=A0A0W0R2N4_9GAMM|nr:ribosome maturation factor RimM [Legionella adelaidensis]KTC65277.1 16S rRNA processing protein RimM [Legionella adelaidensis]VEH81239.1 16S rRNA processing protein RimM [Legionella adelaidensis]